MNPTIRQQFRARRAELEMPYTALARRAGVSLSTVKRAYAGKGTRLDTLAAIAHALGLRLDATAVIDVRVGKIILGNMQAVEDKGK